MAWSRSARLSGDPTGGIADIEYLGTRAGRINGGLDGHPADADIARRQGLIG